MWFGILGSLLVRNGTEVRRVPAARQRAILAALLVRAGQAVPADALAEMAWNGAPPAGAQTTLRSHVMRLRRALGADAGERIVTRYPGYLIEAGEDEVDLLQFTRLCQQGGAAARAGAWRQAAEVLARALLLWRGPPLADVRCELLHRDEVPRIEELRLQALEWRIEAGLRLARHGEMLPELQSLVVQHPLRERFHEQLMLALCRSGRPAEALGAYQQVRATLAGELGAEPGIRLRELHQRILAGDTDLASGPTGLVVAGGPGPVVPRQLPAAVRHFTGRAAELKTLAGLAGQPAGGTPGTVVISAIGGTAGVGKTALALQFAHQVAGQFPDGQLYLNLRGFDESGDPVRPADAIHRLLTGLGVAAEVIPADLDAQSAMFRSVLAGRRVLIVLDNAADAAQVRPLLPSSPDCLAVVTSRNQLTALAVANGAYLVTLDVMTEAEARELLARRLGRGRVAGEPAAARELARLCARLPLALSVAAARAAARPTFSLAGLATELRDAHGRLDALSAGEAPADVRAAFSWSYQQLSDPAGRMFRLLGLHPGPDITVPAAASLTGLPHGQAHALLSELTDAGLITEHLPGRFAFHDLLREYASEQAEASEEGSSQVPFCRMLDHYLRTAHAADERIYPTRRYNPPLPQRIAGTQPEAFPSSGQALAWFEAEHPVLIAAVKLAAARGLDTYVWQLPFKMEAFFYIRGHWHEWAATQRLAQAAAERLGDTVALIYAHRGIGNASTEIESLGDAEWHLMRALRLCADTDDRIRARLHLDVARLRERQDRYPEALRHAKLGLRIFREFGDKAGQADALNHVGWHECMLGKYDAAIVASECSLEVARQYGHEHSQGPTLDTLGYAYSRLGRHAEAAACYSKAVLSLEAVGYTHAMAVTLGYAGDAYHAAGDVMAARRAWEQALSIFEQAHHPDAAAAVRAKLAGPRC